MRSLLIILMLVFSMPILAKGGKTVETIGSREASRGGTLNLNLESEPETINPITFADGYAGQIEQWVMESLLMYNPRTGNLVPALAERYEVSKDGLTFTFHLRKNIQFSDGQPITSVDVRFSFECYADPKYKAPHRRIYVEDVARIETPDAQTVKIVMKRKYFKNLEVLGGVLKILPKHIYEDPTKPLSKTMIGSGPYKIGTYDHGKSLELVRNDRWWGFKTPTSETANQGKFDRIAYRFVNDENLRFEMLKKGQIDMLDRIEPDTFVQKATGEPFDSKIIKHKEENQDPNYKLFNFIAWNFRNPLFKDRNVRVALAELMNRPLMNEKFRFNLSDLAAGPSWHNERVIDPKVKPLPFDPQHASELLKKAGWEDKEKKGVLQKEIDGKKVEFRFTLVYAKKELEKYFTLYKEDLKNAGIDLQIQFVEWHEFVKLLNEQKFDSVALAWSLGSLEPDLKQLFHSESMAAGGSNFGGYSNPEVDKLLDKVRIEMDYKKRKPIWQKIYRLIAEDAPYAFMFSTKYDLYLAWNTIAMTKGTLKYDRGVRWWWSMQK
jgi:peptide/nickel transport system substrate-binding protein/microcin C transport system substrate-binding protein